MVSRSFGYGKMWGSRTGVLFRRASLVRDGSVCKIRMVFAVCSQSYVYFSFLAAVYSEYMGCFVEIKWSALMLYSNISVHFLKRNTPLSPNFLSDFSASSMVFSWSSRVFEKNLSA